MFSRCLRDCLPKAAQRMTSRPKGRKLKLVPELIFFVLLKICACSLCFLGGFFQGSLI